MRLTELEPEFLTITSESSYQCHDRLAEAQGLMLLCPTCFIKNNGPVGTHRIICWFTGRGVPDNRTPGPGRWTPLGTGFNDLDFMTTRPSASVLLTGAGCGAHFLLQNGNIILC